MGSLEPPTKIRTRSEDSIELVNVLKQSGKGQYVLAFYEKNGVLNRDTRQKLVDLIIEHELNTDISKRYSKQILYD